MSRYYYLPLMIILLLGSQYGCSRNVDGSWKAPFVYRIDIQQGNVIDQEMLNRLQPGMAKDQVKFVMGTPLIMDPFHDDRWDYVYSMEPGSGERSQRRLTLYFQDDKLTYVDGDVKVNPELQRQDNIVKERTVVVPLEQQEDGFFSRTFGKDKEKDTGTDAEGQALAEEPAVGGEVEPEEQIETPIPPELPEKSIVTRDKEDDAAQSAARTEEEEPEQKRNLLRRFWDRMTSGGADSGVSEGEETERDRRDAEVLDSAGGEL